MLENSADPDKVPHFVTPYLGLHHFSLYPFMLFQHVEYS